MKGLIVFVVTMIIALQSPPLSAVAAPDWKESFDRLCAISADSEKLSLEELDTLISESTELLATIEASDSSQKKVYLIRLNKCRNFFIFMRDFKRNPE